MCEGETNGGIVYGAGDSDFPIGEEWRGDKRSIALKKPIPNHEGCPLAGPNCSNYGEGCDIGYGYKRCEKYQKRTLGSKRPFDGGLGKIVGGLDQNV